MSEDFYPFVDSGDPAPDNRHLTGNSDGIEQAKDTETGEKVAYSTRIAVYDDMLSTPRVCVIEPADVRTYLEETTNTVYRCMREQGGSISLMVIREIVENFIHANFAEPIISILDGGNTIRFADQGPGIEDKERAFEFGVTSADRSKKRYIRGTGAGFPMVQQYLENVGGAVSIEDNLGQGTVVTVSMDPARVAEIEMNSQAGAAVRASQFSTRVNNMTQQMPLQASQQMPMNQNPSMSAAVQQQAAQQAGQQYPQQTAPTQPTYQQPQQMPQGQQMQQQWTPQQMPVQNGAWGMPQPWATMPVMNQGMQGQMYMQGMPMGGYPGYPQNGNPMASYQQQQAQMGYPYTANTTEQTHAQTKIYVSERGRQALGHMRDAGSCGPTDLNHTYGNSVSTWSRELEKLCSSGLAIKRGQRFFLTEAGNAWLLDQ